MGTMLVPLGLTDATDDVLEAVAELARASQRKVILLHVIEMLRDTTYEEMADFYQPIEERSREALEKRRSRLAQQGIDCTAEILYGNRVRQILRHAAECDASLIVMSSHVVEEETPPSALATISYQVAALSPCSVLLVK